MIVKTEGYMRNQVGKVVQLRAVVEGLKLGGGRGKILVEVTPPFTMPLYLPCHSDEQGA